MPAIVLYGATGFSGRLAAAVLARRCAAAGLTLIVAGRDGDAVAALAAALGVGFRVFEVHNDAALAAGFAGAQVVVNAAGPFLDGIGTTSRVARAAIRAGAHYTDINGDPAVYLGMQDLGPDAARRGVALVPAAGCWAAGSNLLLDHAFDTIRTTVKGPLKAARIAMSRIVTPSRGSIATVWSALRPTVLVVRRAADGRRLLCQVPVGRLERVFDFGHAAVPRRAVASAASLIDTLAAPPIARQHGYAVDRIESYVEAGFAARTAYMLAGAATPLLGATVVQRLVRAPLALVAAGPSAAERAAEPNAIVLQIEDRFYQPVIDWCWRTPNVYDLTAELVAATAVALATTARTGWQSPARIISYTDVADVPGCTLDRRIG